MSLAEFGELADSPHFCEALRRFRGTIREANTDDEFGAKEAMFQTSFPLGLSLPSPSNHARLTYLWNPPGTDPYTGGWHVALSKHGDGFAKPCA